MKKMLLVAMMAMIVILMSCTMCWAAEGKELTLVLDFSTESKDSGLADAFLLTHDVAESLNVITEEVIVQSSMQVIGTFFYSAEKWYETANRAYGMIESKHLATVYAKDEYSGELIRVYLGELSFGEDFYLAVPSIPGYKFAGASPKYGSKNYLELSVKKVAGRVGVSDVGVYLYYSKVADGSEMDSMMWRLEQIKKYLEARGGDCSCYICQKVRLDLHRLTYKPEPIGTAARLLYEDFFSH